MLVKPGQFGQSFLAPKKKLVVVGACCVRTDLNVHHAAVSFPSGLCRFLWPAYGNTAVVFFFDFAKVGMVRDQIVAPRMGK